MPHKKLRKIFYFGKVNYCGRGRKNAVTVEASLTYKENGQVAFDACGNVWNRSRTDIVMGGQCLDEIRELLRGQRGFDRFDKLYRFWKLYHLNDLNPGLPIQMEALRDCPSKDYEERCKFLQDRGLFEVDGHKYGYEWHYQPIPEYDLRGIEKLLTEKDEMDEELEYF
jgi:hypothetical protein